MLGLAPIGIDVRDMFKTLSSAMDGVSTGRPVRLALRDLGERGRSGHDPSCRDSIAERRFIELGPEFGNNVVVERGIIPGEMIVTEGYHKLTPGIRIRVAAKKEDVESQSSTATNE